jgi:hypothetical protein
MQLQIAQIQGQMQQLLSQQVQLQSQIQQLQAQRGTGVSTPPTLTPPPTPALGPSQPAIQNITEQLTRHPTDRFPTRPLNQIERLIVHHTAVPPSVDAERIAQHRVDRQGWPGIGYHYFITGEGAIQQTNDLTTTARHAGSYDPVAIGICFAGDFTNASPTAQQLQAGAQLIAWLLSNLRLSLQALFGYKELVNTQSPGLQWDGGARWGEQLKAQVKSRLGS